MKFRYISLLAGSALACLNAQDSPSGYDVSKRNQESVIEYLRPVILSARGAARIYYSTACKTQDEQILPFPRVELQTPSKDATGLTAVHEIFRNDKRVNVSQDRSGMIRIVIGEPALVLLQTRVHSLTLKQHERYNPQMAIFAILNSREVEAAMRHLELEQPLRFFAGGITLPEKGITLPHLPATIKDITMDQALDMVARTFGGVVIYETCADRGSKRLVTLDFVPVADL